MFVMLTLVDNMSDSLLEQERPFRTENSTFRHQELLPSTFSAPSRHPSTDLFAKDYDGETGEARAGRDYFKKRFARLAQKANQKEREIYIQYVRPVHLFEPNLPSLLFSKVH